MAGGVRYRPARGAADAGDTMVKLDLAKADRSWRGDTGFYVPPGGGADAQKYANAAAFIADPDNLVDAPRVTYDGSGLSFVDGRHRTAAARDQGRGEIWVTAHPAQAGALERDLGAAARPSAHAEADRPFTGTITDKAGHKRKYERGREVPLHDRKPGPEYDRKPAGEQAPAPHPDSPSPDEVTAHVVGRLKPELARRPGVAHRIALAVAKVYPKVEYAARRLSLLSLEVQNDILDVVEDYEKITYSKTGAQGQPQHDPVYVHLGVPANVAFTIISKAVGFIAGRLGQKKGSTVSQHAEAPDPADVVLDLIRAMREATGRQAEPLPTREEVAARLAEKARARAANPPTPDAGA